jgi:hypothetical protein
MTQQNAALVEQSTAAAESLKEQAHKLNTIVATFKVDGAAAKAASRSPVGAAPSRPAMPAPAAKPAERPAATAKAVIERASQARPLDKPVAPKPVAAAAPKAAAAAPLAAAALPVVTQVVAAAPADDGDWETF